MKIFTLVQAIVIYAKVKPVAGVGALFSVLYDEHKVITDIRDIVTAYCVVFRNCVTDYHKVNITALPIQPTMRGEMSA